MKIRQSLLFLLLLSFCIQINLTKCNPDKSFLTSPVYQPTNEYEVFAVIVKISGFSGCSNEISILIKNDDELIRNAIVIINDEILSVDEDTLLVPFYSSENILFNDNTKYSLEVSLDDEIIASGNSIMPAILNITNINNNYHHSLNENLKIKWSTVKNATAIELLTENYSSGLLIPTASEHTIPDTVFKEPGEYSIVLIAYNGINPGFEFNEYDFEQLEKGYNIKGATGIFVVANIWSGENGFNIIVDPLDSSTVKKCKKNSTEEIVQILKQRVLDYTKFKQKKSKSLQPTARAIR